MKRRYRVRYPSLLTLTMLALVACLGFLACNVSVIS